MDIAVPYARQRVARGTPIASKGNIQGYAVDVRLLRFGAQSMAYRMAGEFEEGLSTIGAQDAVAKMDDWRARAVEAAVGKVYGSGAVNHAISQTIQILGGYGYMEDYGLAGMARDHRVETIYEGENGLMEVGVVAGEALSRIAKKRIQLNPSTPDTAAARLSAATESFKGHSLADLVSVAERAKELATWGLGLAVEHSSFGALRMLYRS